MNRDMCGTCHEAGLLIALFVGRPLNRGLADVVLLVSFLYASVQTLAPCTALSSLHLARLLSTVVLVDGVDRMVDESTAVYLQTG